MPNVLSGEFANLRAAGYYLPPLLSFYIGVQLLSWPYLTISILSLLGAIGLHGGVRAVHGPAGPEENPLETKTQKQRFLVLLFGVGPAKNHPANFLDIGLNYEAYSKYYQRPRPIIITSIIITGAVSWIISVGISLINLPNQLPNPEFPVLVLYFALFAWLLQNFIIWKAFLPVYFLEDNIEDGYDIHEGDRSLNPDRPANWMVSGDALILKIIHQKSFPVSPLLITHYYARYHAESTSEMILWTFDGAAEISERLQELSSHGLVKKYDDGRYELSVMGRDYLFGKLGAEFFEN
ncbi:hypothetical protein [Natrinema saccharevitans]|uniref:hypothetical protein n=1 Tax=Natrinema saccharevitans TaxID=301967 RepID=UPI0011155F28|nr:hypothetical protein [Natrinema saccharevitans]